MPPEWRKAGHHCLILLQVDGHWSVYEKELVAEKDKRI